MRQAFGDFPQGDLAFHISVPPQVAFARRRARKYGLDAYEFNARLYDELLSKHPKILLDGTADVDSQLSRVSDLVSRHLEE